MRTRCNAFVLANLLILLLLCYLSWLIPSVTWPAIGLGICQLVSLAAFVVCSDLSLLEKLKWTYQLLTAQWLCILLPTPLDSIEWPVLYCTIVNQLVVFGAAMFSVWFASIATGRGLLVEPNKNNRDAPALRLLDLVVFTFFLAIVVWMISHSEPVQRENGWTGLGYNLLILLGLYFGLPVGFFLPLVLLGTMMDAKYYSYKWLGGWMAFVALNTTLLLASPSGYGDVNGLLTFVVATAVPAIAFALFFRWQGVRFAKRPDQIPPESRTANQTF